MSGGISRSVEEFERVDYQLLSVNDALYLAIDIAVHSVENAWSAIMYDKLIVLFGDSQWRSTCQRLFFQETSTSSTFLPSNRSEIFDLYTLMRLLTGIQRFAMTSFQPGNPTYSTSAQSYLHVQSNDYSACNLSALSPVEVCQWTSYLANIVFAFRQRWSHDSNSLSPQEVLDALLALQELWSCFNSYTQRRDIEEATEGLNDEKEQSGGNLFYRSQFDKAVRLVRFCCSLHVSATTSPFTCDFSCCHILMAKIVCAQLVHTLTPYLDKVLHFCQINIGNRTNSSWTDLIKLIPVPRAGISKNGNDLIQDIILNCILSDSKVRAEPINRDCELRDFRSNLCKLNSVRKIAFHSAKFSLATLVSGLNASRKLLTQLGGSEVDFCVVKRSAKCIEILKHVCRRRDFQSCKCVHVRVAWEQQQPENDFVHFYVQQPRAKPYFIGRDMELLRIRHSITSGHLTVVLGDGGSGKTALVIEVVYNLRKQFPIQCWLPASSSRLLQLGLSRWTYVSSKAFANCSKETLYTISPPCLLVADDVRDPAILDCIPDRSSLAIICTSVCQQEKVWNRTSRPCSMYTLLPLNVASCVRMIQARVKKYTSDPSALAELLLNYDMVSLLENQVNQPVHIHKLAAELRKQSLTCALQNQKLQYKCLTLASDNCEASRDLGRFHSDGPEIFLQHSWPQLSADAQVLLLAISLLCRHSSSLPDRLVLKGCSTISTFLDGKISSWQLFLLGTTGTLPKRRRKALQHLCDFGLLNWESRTIHHDNLLQREVESRTGVCAMSGLPPTVIIAEICIALQYILLETIRDLPVEDCHPNSLSFRDVFAFYLIKPVESLLSIQSQSSSVVLSLRIWLARSYLVFLFDYDAAIRHYKVCVGQVDDDEPESIIVYLECGMAMWRSDQAESGLELLLMSKTSLENVAVSAIPDICYQEMHALHKIDAIVQDEMHWATLNLHKADTLCPEHSRSWENDPNLVPSLAELHPKLTPIGRHEVVLYSECKLYQSFHVIFCNMYVLGRICESLDWLLEAAVTRMEQPASLSSSILSFAALHIVMRNCHLCSYESFVYFSQVTSMLLGNTMKNLHYFLQKRTISLSKVRRYSVCLPPVHCMGFS